MKNIIVWDWKYKIFFDKKVQFQVEKFIAGLQGEEKNIYNKIKDYYLSFYSLSILIDAIKNDPQKTQEFIDYAWVKKDIVIKTPQILYQPLTNDIKKLGIPENSKSFINTLLTYSINYGQEINYIDVCGTFFGDSFSVMIDEVMKVKKPQKLNHGEKLSAQNVADLYQIFYKQLCKNVCLNDNFGSCAIISCGTKINNDVGYAEWWDRELLESKEDLLILHTNPESLNSNDLFYTIIHEMYPGHGHFYNTVTHSDHLVDHGAMSIVEGWATYVEWNSIESDYAKTCRNNALFFLKGNAIGNINERATRTYNQKIEQGYRTIEALRTTRYATQYLGYLESYYYGAIWIELFIKKNNIKPRTFLSFLSKRNIGDFLAIWARL